ncbi:glycosyltransferase family 2 protein [Vibrio sp. A2-1]|uniref:glycosyltransferase family 2 protein n=1 Tax=Vibrio sp. A2-1 TaxID=2912252 RepID=UPI001F1F1545|nr:glycosyltransferase family 2 protein [Vibrio sp. A2-1]MCF7487634.1 glycosyltransferase [Vibrio sp. A2-1]
MCLVKFSIVIPVYNKQEYIINSIESVLQQTFSDFEIIFVDDGSVDSSVDVINQAMIGKDVSWYLVSGRNFGVSNARNKGIALARGEFIAFLDADDIWHKDYLATLNRVILQNPNERYFTSNYKERYTNEAKKESVLDFDFDTINCRIVNYCVDQTHFYTSSVCISKDVFSSNLFFFDENQTHAEDTDVWFKLSLRYDTVFIDNALVYYVQCDTDSATSNIQKLDYSTIFDKKVIDNIHTNLIVETKNVKKYIDNQRLRYVKSNLKRGNLTNARKIIMNGYSIPLIFFLPLTFFPAKLVVGIAKLVRKLVR